MSGSQSANAGTAPAQVAAWAVAENVKLGISTGRPGAARAWTTSMSPVVHDDTATTWGTPSRSAHACSSWRTSGPLVSIPRS